MIIFSYLCSRRAVDDTVAFSISELCHWSHLKLNYHDGKINHKYLEVLELLSHYGYFENCPDFEELADELDKILNFKEVLKGVKVDDESNQKIDTAYDHEHEIQ